jgi:hypothetical protein
MKPEGIPLSPKDAGAGTWGHRASDKALLNLSVVLELLRRNELQTARPECSALGTNCPGTLYWTPNAMLPEALPRPTLRACGPQPTLASSWGHHQPAQRSAAPALSPHSFPFATARVALKLVFTHTLLCLMAL